MDSQHTIFIRLVKRDVSVTIVANDNHLSRADSVLKLAADDITISTGRKACLQGFFDVAFAGDGDKSSIAATEGDLIVSIGPPVVQSRAFDGIHKSNHAVDLSPTVFTNPAIITGPGGVGTWSNDVAISVLWWT